MATLIFEPTHEFHDCSCHRRNDGVESVLLNMFGIILPGKIATGSSIFVSRGCGGVTAVVRRLVDVESLTSKCMLLKAEPSDVVVTATSSDDVRIDGRKIIANYICSDGVVFETE